MQFGALVDPLMMNLRRQWKTVVPFIQDSFLEPHQSEEQLVHTLSRLLRDPRYTLLIAQKFRPILFILCTLWLDQEGEGDSKLAALALLVNPHEELFP